MIHTVHVRVNDAATGEPTPVRLRITNPSGEYFAPFGRLAHFATGPGEDVGGNLQVGQKKFAFIDGSCEIEVPAGPLVVEVSKGPEYRPIRQEINQPAGKMTLRLSIERWIDLRKEGWYAGDTGVHFLSPHAALLEAAAEDVAVVNLLALNWAVLYEGRKLVPAIPNILDFSGQQPALESPGHMVVVNTLNNGDRLGVLALLNCHRVVYPLGMEKADDGGASPQASLRACGVTPQACGPGILYSWTLADWCDQCHRKGGLVVWSRIQGETASEPYGEALANLVLGKVDALEVDELDWCKTRHIPWYWLLNCGFRVPLVGASRKMCNTVPIGHVRTYAQLQPGEQLTYKNWIEAVRAGQTFVTNGPLLTFTINEHGPGTSLTLPAGTKKVRLRAEARSIVPFEQLEVVCNGQVLAGTEASGDPTSATLEGEIEVPAGGWWAARCWGWDPKRTGEAHFVAAHSSPIYVQVEGRPTPVDPIMKAHVADHLEQTRAWVETEASVASDKVRTDLLQVLKSAMAELARRV